MIYTVASKLRRLFWPLGEEEAAFKKTMMSIFVDATPLLGAVSLGLIGGVAASGGKLSLSR
ncbi:hypothetical protein EV426DRAFT_707936 [Tirmania nivea]|nr:hypothetical protein EV426DRAFT_707936 [Tirmania nivea]